MPRQFPYNKPTVCYDKPQASLVDKAEYDHKRKNALNGTLIEKLIVPKKSAITWQMQKGDLCRVTVIEGPQVADLNFFNADNYTEHFYSGKTRQLHATHLTTYDRFWSCLPFLNPMATIVYDSLSDYGIDEDGGSVHDVIGTRCDDYTYKLITGKDRFGSCHSYLTQAVKKYGIAESLVHDVFNLFMLTGIKRDTQQYFCKPSPVVKGDNLEFIADMNLLVALSTCPQGDVSVPVGQEVPDSICHPLGVEIFRAN
jgi:uncharacterized protein YcgI (DUF1989 family)